MLFLGNSYTFVNELDKIVAGIYAEAGAPVEAERLAEGGYTFVDHNNQRLASGSAWEAAFAAPHDVVILQDQSQIPGFGAGNPDFEADLAAAVALDGAAAATGADTWFLMTWGRRDGDSTNPGIYPDYTTMQAALAEGYGAYRDAASADGTPAWIVPAGLAWQVVHDAEADPTAPGSAFYDLYIDDGSHPSMSGSWLTACVIYTALTGLSAEGLTPPEGVHDGEGLAAIAASVVLDGDGTYPWRDPSDDTGDGGDTGDTAGDTGDTAGDTGGSGDTADSGGDPSDTGDATDDGSGAGCGCTTAAPAGWSAWAVALLGGLGWRRRRGYGAGGRGGARA